MTVATAGTTSPADTVTPIDSAAVGTGRSAAGTAASAAGTAPSAAGTGPQTAAAGVPTDLTEVFGTATDGSTLRQAYAELGRRHTKHRRTYLGFPVAYDLDFPLTREHLSGGLFNNISVSTHWPPGFQHAMEAESCVLDWLGGLVGIPPAERWGHLTTGGTAGNRTGIRAGRAKYPDAVLIHSAAAHYSVPRAGRDLRIPTFEVPTDPTGHMDLNELDVTLRVITRGKTPGSVPIIVLATYGTTMTEAGDDLTGIHAVLSEHRITRRYVHLDAALAGIPLALDKAADFSRADSISVSGYKFLAVPDACGVIVGRGGQDDLLIPYTDTLDATETGVRSGLHAALLLESIRTVGDDGHRARAHASRHLADHVIKRLGKIGVHAWRNPEAYFTIILPTPPPPVLDKWTLSNHPTGISHVLTIPGHEQSTFDEFIEDLATAIDRGPRDPFAAFRRAASKTAARAGEPPAQATTPGHLPQRRVTGTPGPVPS